MLTGNNTIGQGEKSVNEQYVASQQIKNEISNINDWISQDFQRNRLLPSLTFSSIASTLNVVRLSLPMDHSML
jgi:hypothetical protein